jgi:hypothetical protein
MPANPPTRRAGVVVKVLGVLGVFLTVVPVLFFLGALALGRTNHELREGVFIIARTSVLFGLFGLAFGAKAGYKGTDRWWAACAGAGVIQIFDFLLFVLTDKTLF